MKYYFSMLLFIALSAVSGGEVANPIDSSEIVMNGKVGPWDAKAKELALAATIDYYGSQLKLHRPPIFVIQQIAPEVLKSVKKKLKKADSVNVRQSTDKIETSELPYEVLTGEFGTHGNNAFGFVSIIHGESSKAFIVLFSKNWRGSWTVGSVTLSSSS